MINKIIYREAYNEKEKNKIFADDSSKISEEKKSEKDPYSLSADTIIRTFEGLVKINSIEKSFRDCSNPDSLYKIKDETGSLVSSFKKLIPLPDVYGSVFAAVKGYIIAADSSDLENERYYKVLVIKEVIAVEGKNFRNTCIPYDYWCLGNEPGWSLQISKSENVMELFLLSENKSYYFFYNEPKTENGEIKYFGYNNIQRTTLNISLKMENCSDTMSERIYEYSAKVNLNDKIKLSGCAIKGNFTE